VTGYSGATWGSPVRPGSYDAFVAKLSGSGDLLWNTFLGASYNDSGNGIAVDTGGNVYVTGSSGATWGSPVRPFSDLELAMLLLRNSTGAALCSGTPSWKLK